MTIELVLITVTAIAGLEAAGLWALWPQAHATLEPTKRAYTEDMFAYTMQDDPC